MLAKSCVLCCVLVTNGDGDDHGVHWAITAQALAWWRRLGASDEATDMLHRAMCLVPYCPVGMVIAFVVNCVTFYYIVNNRVAIN
jgi:hypothetical protein